MNGYEQTAAVLKALGHPVRLQILDLLQREGEACVCHLETRLGQRQAYISQQLARLREAGLIEDRREGLNIFYSVAMPESKPVLELAKDLAAARAGVSNSELLFEVHLPAAPLECPCPSCEEVPTVAR